MDKVRIIHGRVEWKRVIGHDPLRDHSVPSGKAHDEPSFHLLGKDGTPLKRIGHLDWMNCRVRESDKHLRANGGQSIVEPVCNS